jgi:hypothetical protein
MRNLAKLRRESLISCISVPAPCIVIPSLGCLFEYDVLRVMTENIQFSLVGLVDVVGVFGSIEMVVFEGCQPNISYIIQDITDEAKLWCMVDPKGL